MNSKIVSSLIFIMSLLFASSANADGITPAFGHIASGWNEPQSISMDPFWAGAGLQERGTNYYIVGGPSSLSPFWSRFDPKSPLYQAWFGSYVVSNFQFASEWNKSFLKPSDIPNSIQRVLALASIDQIVWLTAYGDPAPKADVVPGTVAVIPLGANHFGMYCRMQSHSDVGAPVLPYPWYPPASSDVEPFAPVILHSTAVFKYLAAEQRLVVAYAVAAEWDTKDGAHHITPPHVITQQAIMIANTRFK